MNLEQIKQQYIISLYDEFYHTLQVLLPLESLVMGTVFSSLLY